ncbi:MAG: SH3 domain-containing protein [Anaerolineae bacterium]|nr:SH3 domain-containing protein [Anaerolineae bacterium]
MIWTLGLLTGASLAVLMLAVAAMAYPAMASTLLERVGVTHPAVAPVVDEAAKNEDNLPKRELPSLKIESVEFVSASGNIPIRASPNEGGDVLAWVQQGEAVPVTGKTADMTWLQVRVSNVLTNTGWVRIEEGRVNGSVNAVPQIPMKSLIAGSEP